MDAVSYETLVRVLVQNDYHNLRVVTEHTFELCRGETSRFTVRRTRLGNVQSAAHFVANSLELWFDKYPPQEAAVNEALKLYRIVEIPGSVLLNTFRSIVEGSAKFDEDVEKMLTEVEELFSSFGPSQWAIQLIEEWNRVGGVLQTDTELIFLNWFTTA